MTSTTTARRSRAEAIRIEPLSSGWASRISSTACTIVSQRRSTRARVKKVGSASRRGPASGASVLKATLKPERFTPVSTPIKPGQVKLTYSTPP